tara:strand:+ start:836 stop:1396 length:561 start_codon:yes stop_codon:yes gene_type:complete
MSNINHEYRHVFIHTPACAGTSMERMEWVGGSGHATAIRLLAEAPADYVSWGFVRNPYDRLVSVYHKAAQHVKKWPGSPQCEGVTFSTFVRSLQRRWIVTPHTLPMTTFLCDVDNACHLDYTGRFETVDKDIKVIADRLGAPHTQLPHLNPTQHDAWQEYYSPELYEIVGELYSDDFDVFGYKREY